MEKSAAETAEAEKQGHKRLEGRETEAAEQDELRRSITVCEEVNREKLTKSIRRETEETHLEEEMEGQQDGEEDSSTPDSRQKGSAQEGRTACLRKGPVSNSGSESKNATVEIHHQTTHRKMKE